MESNITKHCVVTYLDKMHPARQSGWTV